MKKMCNQACLLINRQKLIRYMKLTILFVFVGLMSVSAASYSQATKLNLQIENASITDFFSKIEEVSDYYFFFKNDALKNSKKVSLNVKNQTIDKILDIVLGGTDLKYRIVDHYIVISNSMDGGENSLLQQDLKTTVKGSVKSQDGEGIPGVTVAIKGSSMGTITDSNGNYSLNVTSSNATLVFSFVGLKTQEIPVNNKGVVNVVMEEESIGLEEVVAIGYGTVKKKDLTGAVSSVDAKKLEAESTSNMTDLLRGTLPGLSVNFSTSAKGLSDSKDMLIRGNTSVRAKDSDGTDDPQKKANAPLIVVDGMIYYGDLSDINPVDIESYDILKDASSAAIYGARASNGVIIITTKKGKKGKPTINVTTSIGVASLSNANIPIMNAQQFTDWRIAGFEANEKHQIDKGAGYYNSPTSLPSGVSLDAWKAYDGSGSATDNTAIWLNRIGFSPIEIANYEAGKTDDFSKYSYQTGFTQDYNVSLSGSSDAVSYYWSLGYTNNEGIRYNETFNTIRSRINLEAKVTNWLKVGTNTNFAVRDESPILASDNLLNNTPYASMFEEDGITPTYAPTGNVSNSRNPWLDLVYRDRVLKYNTLNAKIYGTLTLPFGISFTSEYITRFNWNREYNSYNSGHLDWGVQGGRASRQNTTIFEYQINNILKWNKTFGDHNFDVTFVQNAEKYQYWRDYMERQQFQPSDVLGYHRMQAATEDVNINSEDQVSTGDALLARLNYTYKSRYNLTTSFRRDGYSAFGQKNPRADFGSAALGWTISEEEFYNIPWMEQLKLRFSYGTNGNRGVGIYDALSNLATGKFVLIENGVPQYVSQLYTSNMANPNLKWERTGSFNAGLDFSVFKGRIRGNIEAYKMKTTDLLIPRQLPPITGYSSVFSNLGQVDNTGFEVTLNSDNLKKGDLKWTTSLSLSHNKNKVVHLYGDKTTDADGNVKEVDDINNGWFIGHSLDQIWDYKILGVWQVAEKDEAAKYSRAPGDFKLLDVNGDGYYTNDDKQFQGYQSPKFRISFRNDFQYKEWEFSLKMYSYLGYFTANDHKKNNDVFYDRGTSFNAPYWTPANPSNEWARVESYESGFTVWENNSFIRLDNVALSYSVPKNLLKKVSIVSCKLSVVAQNPYVWSPKWSWMDPESHGYTPSYYSLKLNLTL